MFIDSALNMRRKKMPCEYCENKDQCSYKNQGKSACPLSAEEQKRVEWIADEDDDYYC